MSDDPLDKPWSEQTVGEKAQTVWLTVVGLAMFAFVIALICSWWINRGENDHQPVRRRDDTYVPEPEICYDSPWGAYYC